jgi:GH15 family glucan-1,4-alpha-glucosidase
VARAIEDYALIGDMQTAALIDCEGSLDWACFPRFDSSACFAALLGERGNGRWRIAPTAIIRQRRRRYRAETLILETELVTDEGECRLIDFMPIRGHAPDIVRIIEGVRGEIEMCSDLVIRFDNGRVVPWVRRCGDALTAIGGPDALCLRGDVVVHGEDMHTIGRFSVGAGQRKAMVLTWYPSHQPTPAAVDAEQALEQTERWWRSWSARLTYEGPFRAEVATSLRVLKALTYAPTGGIVAAPTTSLPEWPGGVRNWDYRYCWLRDATLTLYAFMLAGYVDEASAWREWLLRAAAGDPEDLQIMYGVAGERRLTEHEAPWLSGFQGSLPVRLGNQAHEQLQLDVYAEVIDALHQARRFGIAPDRWARGLELALLDALESKWRQPDEGIWEIRGPRRQLTHSKVMAWMAFDRAIKSVERFRLEGPVERWRQIRDEIHGEVCARAFDPKQNSFTQSYGRPELDAALLIIPQVGFLPIDDPRVIGTVRAIERDLMRDGFLLRYRTDLVEGDRQGPPASGGSAGSPVDSPAGSPSGSIDGLPPGEGIFLPCSFWLVDTYVQMGRREEALQLFQRVLTVANDVGLLSEQYDPRTKRLLGNFPQAFTHLALVNTAFNLSDHPTSAARHRHGVPAHPAGGGEPPW